MEPAIPLREPSHVPMAGQAAPLHGFFSAAMATGAFESAFELLVDPGQWAGRHLALERLSDGTMEQPPESDQPDGPDHQNQVIPIPTTTPTWITTATSAASANGRCATCQRRNTRWVASSMRTCWVNAIS